MLDALARRPARATVRKGLSMFTSSALLEGVIKPPTVRVTLVPTLLLENVGVPPKTTGL